MNLMRVVLLYGLMVCFDFCSLVVSSKGSRKKRSNKINPANQDQIFEQRGYLLQIRILSS
jgi:hypothetical protein